MSQITVFVRCMPEHGNWFGYFLTCVSKKSNHLKILNAEIGGIDITLLSDGPGVYEVLKVETGQATRANIYRDDCRNSFYFKYELNASDDMIHLLEEMTSLYLVHSTRVSYIQIGSLLNVAGELRKMNSAALYVNEARVYSGAIVVIDGSNLRRTMERIIDNLDLFSTYILFKDVFNTMARDMDCSVILMIPQFLKAHDSGIMILALQRFIGCKLYVLWSEDPPADDEQMARIMRAHDDRMRDQGKRLCAYYMSNDKGRNWNEGRLLTRSRQIKWTFTGASNDVSISIHVQRFVHGSQRPVHIDDVVAFAQRGQCVYNGIITFFMLSRKYGFIELESGIVLKFGIDQCDSKLKWDLSAKKTRLNPFIPAMVYTDPSKDHAALAVFSDLTQD